MRFPFWDVWLESSRKKSSHRSMKYMCPCVQPPRVQVTTAVTVTHPPKPFQAMSMGPMDTEAEITNTDAGVPWRSDIKTTPLMQDLLSALTPELVSPEATTRVRVKLLDSRDDREDDEPNVPISGSEILEIGKYAKRQGS